MSVGTLYATEIRGDIMKRINEKMDPKQKQHSIVDAIGDGSTVWCCKEQ